MTCMNVCVCDRYPAQIGQVERHCLTCGRHGLSQRTHPPQILCECCDSVMFTCSSLFSIQIQDQQAQVRLFTLRKDPSLLSSNVRHFSGVSTFVLIVLVFLGFTRR